MKENKFAAIDIHGLKCDNPDCDYVDMSIPYEAYGFMVNSRCPKCGCILLTEADYQAVQKSIKVIAFINKIASYFPKPKKEPEYVSFSGHMNGTGKIKFLKNNNK